MIRALLSLLLAFTLATTSVSAAVMRGEMLGSVQIEICADADALSGLTTITLDATGKPIGPHHTCHDCTAALAALLPEALQIAAPMGRSIAVLAAHSFTGTSRDAPQQTARDPPHFA